MWGNFLQSLFKVRDARMYALCGTEAIIVAAVSTAAFFLRFPMEEALENLAKFWWMVPLGVAVRIVLFWLFGMYRWVWHYMGMREVLYLVGAVTVASVVLGGITYGLDATFSETLLLVDWLLVMAVMLGERLSIRLWHEHSTRQTLPESGVKSDMLPGQHELSDAEIAESQLKDIEIEDLFRRGPGKPDLRESGSYLRWRRILVTGAAGWIGSELCRQIAGLRPVRLVLFDRNENDLRVIEREMRKRFPQLKIETVVGNIQNKGKAEELMKLCRPEVIFHAAAHRHVRHVKANLDEAVLNNILATRAWLEAAERYGVERFVFISTNKAVNPTSVMGATMKVAEMLIQAKSSSKTKFMVVRVGNVLGSRGSVVPLFRKQIAQGGPVTVTDPEIMRSFMTVDETVSLIIKAAALGKGGELFVFDMGQPVKIIDLARDMIELSGLKEGENIEIEFIGLRPGEELSEEIPTEMEGISTTRYEKVFLAKVEEVDRDRLDREVADLESRVSGRESSNERMAENGRNGGEYRYR